MITALIPPIELTLNKNRTFSVIWCVSLCLFAFFPVNAEASRTYKKLTEQNIEAFIRKTTALSAGEQGDLSDHDVEKYFETHLDEDARFKSTIKYNIPGFPSQENALALNKESFIQNMKDARASLQNYETDVTVKNINISSDKKKATVSTESYETGVMPVPTQDGSVQEIPMEGMSRCNQIITLSTKGIIQMYSAICTTKINFSGL